MESIEDRALVEYMRRWRVEILGQCIREDTSRESDRMPHRIGDREGDTTIEFVTRLRDEESRLDDKITRKSRILECKNKIPRRTRIPKLELANSID